MDRKNEKVKTAWTTFGWLIRMSGMLVTMACFVVLATLTVGAGAQPIEVWNTTYDGGSADIACGVAVDSGGNVYVTGLSAPPGGTKNYYTIKYAQSAQSAEAALENLIDQVADLNLQQGLDNSLDAKLEAAMNALEDINENNDVAAINSLEAFIKAVAAQRDKKISDADALIAAAQEIISLLIGT
jgi:hypothetical protein